MTGYPSKKKAAQAKTIDEVNWVDHELYGLAQPAQEPVAWMHVQGNYEEPSFRQLADDEVERGWQQYPLYTTPPQRPWIDLTDNQIEQIYYDLVRIHRGAPMPWGQIQFGKVLQAAIREANT